MLQATAQPAELATVSRGATAEGTVPEPVTKTAAASRAQAVQDAILQASDATSSDSDADQNASDSEAESNDEILAQLSESMWASLRPDAHTAASALEPAKAQRDAAQSDSLRKAQPKGLQADHQDTEVGKLQHVPKLCYPWDKSCLCVFLLWCVALLQMISISALQISNSCFAFGLAHSDGLKLTFECIVHAHILGLFGR